MNKLTGLLSGVLLVLNFAANAEEIKKNGELIDIEVHRSPTCGCCGRWISHLEKNKFRVKDYITDDVQALKDKVGVSAKMASCHTALVNGYVVEGHVPATDIKKLLNIKPSVIGISVPGMPIGTPGMEMGGRKDAYDVVSFDKEKKYKVFNRYGKEQ